MKKYGDIIKQHYEKVILIAALVGLGLAVFYLYSETQKEKDKISEFFQDVGRRAVKPVPPVNLTNYTVVINKAQNPPPLDLGRPHNVLNPVKWKQTSNGDLFKEVIGTESGLDLLEITRHDSLDFSIHFERVAGSGYWINITNEAVAGVGRRLAQFATLNSTNLKVFILREVKGPPEEPTELVLELKETGERVSISKDKPFVRAEAYEVDLRYPVENRDFKKQRVGATLRFGGEEYKIFAINQNEIVFLGDNDKKYSKPVARREAARAGPPK